MNASSHCLVSQTDAHSCSTSRLGPNNPVGSTFHYTPGGTQHFPPLEHGFLVPQQFYQSSFEPTLIHSSLHPSPSPPTQQQITQLQLQLAQSQQREEQLQWQLVYRDQWLQQFQQQLAYLQQQQQQRPEQLAAPQNTPPFQEPLPMNNRPLASTTQPWVSESPKSVASQIPLYSSTDEGRQGMNVPSTSDLAPSPSHGHLSLTTPIEPNLEQSWLLHVLLASQSLAPAATVAGIKIEAERPDRVVTRSRSEGKRHQKRLTNEQARGIISRREGDIPASYQTIAKNIGCSKSTAWRQAKKYERQTKMIQKAHSQ